jgi:hypothetical protein
MSGTFFTLMIMTMMAVLGALAAGIFGMAKGGEFNRKYGNKLMQARVYLQGAAIIFFLLTIVAMKK